MDRITSRPDLTEDTTRLGPAVGVISMARSPTGRCGLPSPTGCFENAEGKPKPASPLYVRRESCWRSNHLLATDGRHGRASAATPHPGGPRLGSAGLRTAEYGAAAFEAG